MPDEMEDTKMNRQMTTARDYATYENAAKAFETAVTKLGIENARFLIMAMPNGRFAPAFVGVNHLQHALATNVAVVG